MNNINIFNADCLEKMNDIEDKSIDLIFTDLPYTDSNFGKCTSCKWDQPIDLELMWKQFKRIRKDTTPIIFTCSTKFGYSLIESNKKEFRYDYIFVKSSCTNFLNSKKMRLGKHELVYVFYKKCPTETYGNNIKKYHKHKFIDNDNKRPTDTYKNNSDLYGNIDRPDFKRKNNESMYSPPLPNSIIKEDIYNFKERVENGKLKQNDRKLQNKDDPIYEPRLPNSVLEIKSEKGLHSTQKPVALSDFFIKYYSNENDIVLDCCMGSGTTGISCINLNRRFIGIEKNEEIFNIAKKRLNIK
jgi:site-specific DNA-methyltransferase (adenine-specific)